MSLSTDRSTLIRLNKDIADLRNKEAAEVKKAADAQKKANGAVDSARRASSPGSAKSYLSTAKRESRNGQTAQDNQSRYSNQAAAKAKEAARVQERISKEEESERKRTVAADDKRRREDDARRKSDAEARRRADQAAAATSRRMQARIDALETQVTQFLESEATKAKAFTPVPPPGQSEAYDVFISHAWEDKEEFVRGLAEKARAAGLRVWFDEFALKWGDSLRQKIDEGLAGSYFGVAVLSPSFFAKEWTNYELDALVERALSGTGRLLPIWHRVTKDDVARRAPSLSNRLALNTSLLSTDDIVRDLVNLRDVYRTSAEDLPINSTVGPVHSGGSPSDEGAA